MSNPPPTALMVRFGPRHVSIYPATESIFLNTCFCHPVTTERTETACHWWMQNHWDHEVRGDQSVLWRGWTFGVKWRRAVNRLLLPWWDPSTVTLSQDKRAWKFEWSSAVRVTGVIVHKPGSRSSRGYAPSRCVVLLLVTISQGTTFLSNLQRITMVLPPWCQQL